jgi:hypothetical protein
MHQQPAPLQLAINTSSTADLNQALPWHISERTCQSTMSALLLLLLLMMAAVADPAAVTDGRDALRWPQTMKIMSLCHRIRHSAHLLPSSAALLLAVSSG